MSDADEINEGAAARIERKLEGLTEAVNKLVLLEERQAVQSQRLDKLEARQERHETAQQEIKAELARWVNRGMGLWGAVALAWAVLNSPAVSALRGG